MTASSSPLSVWQCVYLGSAQQGKRLANALEQECDVLVLESPEELDDAFSEIGGAVVVMPASDLQHPACVSTLARADRADVGNPFRLLLLVDVGPEELARALEPGPVQQRVKGILIMETDTGFLAEAVRHVAGGGVVLTSGKATPLPWFSFAPSRPEATVGSAAFETLSLREREVVAGVARGLSNAELADHLRVSPHTVKTHLSAAMRKLDVRDRTQLAVFAHRNNLHTQVH